MEKNLTQNLQGVDGEGQRVEDDQISRLIVTPHSGQLQAGMAHPQRKLGVSLYCCSIG